MGCLSCSFPERHPIVTVVGVATVFLTAALLAHFVAKAAIGVPIGVGVGGAISTVVIAAILYRLSQRRAQDPAARQQEALPQSAQPQPTPAPAPPSRAKTPKPSFITEATSSDLWEAIHGNNPEQARKCLSAQTIKKVPHDNCTFIHMTVARVTHLRRDANLWHDLIAEMDELDPTLKNVPNLAGDTALSEAISSGNPVLKAALGIE